MRNRHEQGDSGSTQVLFDSIQHWQQRTAPCTACTWFLITGPLELRDGPGAGPVHRDCAVRFKIVQTKRPRSPFHPGPRIDSKLDRVARVLSPNLHWSSGVCRSVWLHAFRCALPTSRQMLQMLHYDARYCALLLTSSKGQISSERQRRDIVPSRKTHNSQYPSQ